MTTRHFDALLRPRSVAVIGASEREHAIGTLVLRNLMAGGFGGPIWPVNPRRPQVGGLPAWPNVAALPGVPDLAVICTPAATVPGLITELGTHGTRAAIVLTAGLKAPAPGGERTLEQAMLDAARPWLLRVLGPNCLGLLVPGIGLNASFAPGAARPGSLAFVSQSGALATALLDWADARDIGFSHFVSLGDSADVDIGDLLDDLGSDGGTRAILLYVESVRAARKFMSAARAAARNKPVLIVKAGRAPEGARAAASHTGALAASDVVFDAAIRRAGLLRVDTLAELFDAAETLARLPALGGDRLAIVTNGGGAGVLAADALSLGGGTLATLSADTLQHLDAVLPATWSHGNPVDLIGDAPVERYTAALDVLLQAPEADAILFMHAPTAVVPADAIAEACLPLLRDGRRPVLTSWLGGHRVEAARARCAAAGIATYETPERAVTGFLHRAAWRRNQEALLQTPPTLQTAVAPDAARARAIVAAALDAGRTMLDDAEVRALLEAYGVPLVRARRVADPDAAAAAAAEFGGPVALKIVSPQISHKSDVGGVALDLATPDAVRSAALAMQRRIALARPDAELTGFVVQEMIVRPRAHELILGLATDPVFGPVLLFGAGGTAVEVIQDRAVALPPLNPLLARELVSRTRVSRLLAGYRDRAAIDEPALVATLLALSQLACDQPDVAELDINPLLADAAGVIALDARVRARRSGLAPGAQLAIRPYPAELDEVRTFPGHTFPGQTLAGRTLRLRPIRPEDEPALKAFYAHATPEDLRLRFFMVRRELPHSELARASQIDYDREMTFVAIDPAAPPDAALLGEVRALCDPDNERAEFAIQVRAGQQGQGLGRMLLERMVEHLRSRGTGEMFGICLPENTHMARLARTLGFEVTPSAGGAPTRMRKVLAGGGDDQRGATMP